MICLICKTPMEPFLNKNGYTIYQCKSCGFGRTDLKKSYTQFVKEFYNKAYFTGDPKHSGFDNYENDKPMIKKNMESFMKHIKLHKPNGKFIDMGCAMGFFIELALSHGFDAYGFDSSTFAVSIAKKLVDDRVKVGTIEDIQYPTLKFDVATLTDVFEHLENPERVLKNIHRVLRKDGIVMIATGDTNSLAAHKMQRRWTFYNPPQHLSYFNKNNLTTLLQRNGFEPIEWFRIGKWLSLGYVLHLARTLSESKLADGIYNIVKSIDSLNKFPLYIPLQDNMVVIARKK
jgi:2-polyprenyl-3-methyl-5-hydroxy-6-metoxy-1,4-benzoquinol methylase